MSNIVEFVVKMKDMMSGNLGKLSSTSQSTFSRMARQADAMNKRNKVLGMSYLEIQKRIREVESTVKSSTIPRQIASAKRELASLQRMAGKHPGNLSGRTSKGKNGGFSVGGMAMGSMLGGVALQAGTALLGVVKDGVGTIISGSMQKQQAITGLSTFIGKDQANEAYANIRKDADATPYDTESLLMVNRSLISAGLNAKDAREDTMNLANAISAVGGGNAELSRMAANMQQIKTVGKASAMDIKQFGMVGINIYEMLSRSTGKSIDEVKKMDVSYNELAKAMAMARGKGGLYEGALGAQSKTMAGKWSTVKDKMSNAMVDIGDAFSPIINKVLDVGIKFANSIGPMLQQVQPYIDMISQGLGTAINYVLNLVTSSSEWTDWIAILSNYYTIVWDFLKSIFSSVWKIVSGVIEWIAKAEIIKDAVRLIHWVFGKIFDVVGWIGEKLVWIWDNVLKPILDGIDSAYKWVKELVTGEKPIELSSKKTIEIQKDFTKPYEADLTRFKGSGVDQSGASTIGKTSALKSKNRASSKSAGNAISGGGTKNVTINVGKFFDNIQFTTMNGQESADKLEQVVMEALGRVLYNGGKLA